MENYADLATLLFPELLASAGGAAPTPAGLQPLQQLGGESAKLDFLALLADQEQAAPVLPAHVPPVRQSLPASGQVLPLPALVSALRLAQLNQAVAVKPLATEPMAVLKGEPKFSPAPVAALPVEPVIKAARGPNIDVLRPVAPTPAPLPLTLSKASPALSLAAAVLNEAPIEETPLPARHAPLPAGLQALVSKPVARPSVLADGLVPVADRAPAPAAVPDVEVVELRGLERLPTTTTPLPTAAVVTVTTHLAQSEHPLPAQQGVVSANVPELPEQLADSVRLLATRQGGEMRLRLNPPELGHLEIKVTVSDEQTFVAITASNSLSRDVLEQHLGRLRSLLDGAGLDLADAQVSSERHSQDQAQQTNAEPVASFSDDSPSDEATPTVSPPSSRQGVDLFA